MTRVLDGTASADARLRPDDVILQVAGYVLFSIDQLRHALAGPRHDVKLLVRRQAEC